MPTIFFSTKLSTLIGNARLSPVDKSQKGDPINDWNAQLFTVDRRKCVIVTNKDTLYSFVRLNVLKKDFNDLNTFFISSLFKQFKADGLYNRKEENYWLDNFSKLIFSRTDNDKKVIGSMNDLIFQLKVAIDYNSAGLANPTDTAAATYVNNIIMGLIQYSTPLEKFRATKNNA